VITPCGHGGGFVGFESIPMSGFMFGPLVIWFKRDLKIHLEGVNRCKANLITNDSELKTNCNTLSVTKECSRIPGDGL